MSAFSASGEPEPFVRDCARAPEIAAFDRFSDAQLVEAIRAERENVYPLIAFYYRYEDFVRGLLAFEAEMPVPARRVWFATFDALHDDRPNLLPVAQWLVPLAARICLEREANQGSSTGLAAPLLWHARRAFERLPDPLRVVAVLSEVAGEEDTRIADFFFRRRLPQVAAEIPQLRAEARYVHTFSLPMSVRRLYFTDPFAVDPSVLLLPQVGLSVSEEIQRFDRWQKIPLPAPAGGLPEPVLDDQVVPEAQTVPAPAIFPPSRSTGGSSMKRPAGLFVGLGVAWVLFGLGAVVYQVTQPRTPTPSTVPPARTAIGPTEPVREIPAVASGGSVRAGSTVSPSILTANGDLPFVDGVAIASPPHFVVVLIADPRGTNLAKVRRLQPKAYYRTLRGTAWIQYGAYNTVERANYGLAQARAAGLTAILAGS